MSEVVIMTKRGVSRGWVRLACFAISFITLPVFAESVSFAYDVRPILAKKCFGCHGPDEAHRKGELRLDTREGIFGAASDFGAIVTKGSLVDSALLHRVTSDDADELMPPPDADEPLSEKQVAILSQWIEEGAVWSDHWSYVAPVRPELPEVSESDWVANGIDHFIFARLEREGLSPSPRATKETLIRRLSLDLTGLPPTWAEVEAFVSDESDDAYEKQVDRLLASPRYGERWARVWLDLARYSDTKGYEKDRNRTIWRYRDYVIDAFNRDMPYDQFTIEQLAGDLLPDATMEQRLATAFHRNTMTNDEGGTDDEEFRVYAVRDRVDTTLQVWMGLTMGCAKCHTHKYDPISIEEYYSFFDFFNQTADADLGSEAPLMAAPTPEQTAKARRLREEIESFERVMNALKESATVRDGLSRWEDDFRSIATWSTLIPASAQSEGGAELTIRDDGSIGASGDRAEQDTYSVTIDVPEGPLAVLRLEALRDESLPGNGPGRNDDGNFTLTRFTATLRNGDTVRPLDFGSVSFSYEQPDMNAASILDTDSGGKTGWAVGSKVGTNHHADFVLAAPVEVNAGERLEITLEQASENPHHLLGAFRFLASSDARTPSREAVPENIRTIAMIAPADRDAEQAAALIDYFVRTYGAVAAPIRDSIRELRQAIDGMDIPKIPILKELDAKKMRTTHVMQRGDFLDLGPEVKAAVPSHFHPFPDDAPRNRLGVAQWLMDPANPLTARVAVNRHWAQFFGRGLVETEEDFGSQGMLPSHPQLLDWLAVEFRESGWSFKALCKTIVMSETYRQSSDVGAALLEQDPDNRLISRGPRYRLDAEGIRDNALAIAGLLSDKMYGPSVMPIQPDGIWKSTYNLDVWTTSKGEDRYRRGLYTFHKRTSPYPSMLTFDATTREWCAIRRFRTNTPLQALVLLNDPVYIEAAQAFARRLLSEADESAEGRVRFALRTALAREAEAFEVEQLVALYTRRLAHYELHLSEATVMSTEPLGPLPPGVLAAEAAAWTAVCNVILNLDEVLTKG